jgi:hypothetical protein
MHSLGKGSWATICGEVIFVQVVDNGGSVASALI